MSTSLLSLALAAASFGQVAAEQPAPADERQEQIKFFKAEAAKLTLLRGPDGKDPQPLTPEPVLRYTNSERDIGSLDGATFLWLEGARPLAAVSLSIRKLQSAAYRECTSFTAVPLVCRSDDAAIWSPKTGGLSPQKLGGAATPAAGKVQRLTQMRELARRFAVTCYAPRGDESTELRLLTQPLYRYSEEKAEVLDGGLFTFVVSNDPEMFLVLEAMKGAGGGENYWQYSLARMSSLKQAVRLDDKEIWAVTNYWQDPVEGRKTGPYVESRFGTFMPAGEAAPPQP